MRQTPRYAAAAYLDGCSRDEVTAFVETGEFLGGVTSPEPRWLVTADWPTARQLAYSQELVGHEVWVDLREGVSAALASARTGAPDDVKATIGELRNHYYTSLSDRFGLTPAGRLRRRKAGLPPHPAGEVIDDIHADLSILLEARLLGVRLPLFEEIFAAYRAGGWPCGWRGSHPTGRLVVFTPSTAETASPSVG